MPVVSLLPIQAYFQDEGRLAPMDDSLVSFLEDKLDYLKEAEKMRPRHALIILKDAHQYFDVQSPLYSPKALALCTVD